MLTTVEELAVIGAAERIEDGLARFAAWPDVELVIKDGAAPCAIRAAGQVFRVPAVRVERVVDTTAAGDSFSAAYLLGRCLGLPVEDSARAAHAVAGAVVQHSGAVVPADATPDVFAERIEKLLEPLGGGGRPPPIASPPMGHGFRLPIFTRRRLC